MKESIFLYHTNDLHSYFDHWPQVATILKERRSIRDVNDEAHYTIDIGDHMDRVHPITEATMGQANVELLNRLNYDIVTLGNNEGITLPYEQLYNLYNEARFNVVCANLNCLKENKPSWLKCHHIVETEGQLKIGFFGLTAPFNPYYHELSWHVDDPIETIANELNEWEEEVDIIVLLSHLGIYDDEQIAKTFPQIDVIIGGHTHHLFRDGEYVNQTLLAACGKQCSHVGEIELVWDHSVNKLVRKSARTYNVEDYPKDLLTEQRIAELSNEAAYVLNKTITKLYKPLQMSWYKESEIMKSFTDELKDWTNADCALLNAGLLLDGLPAGNISYFDIHRICPHPINPVLVQLTGSELIHVLERSCEKDFMELKLKGFGFRGELLGKMITSNIDVEWDGNKVQLAVIGGKLLDKNKIYKVATGDLFTFGRLLPEIAQAEERKLYMPEFLRDILMRTVIRIRSS